MKTALLVSTFAALATALPATAATTTYTFDTAASFTAAEAAFDYNPGKPNFRFDYGTGAGSASHGATFTTFSGNGAVQVSEGFNYAANGAGGNAYTIDLFPSPSPTNVTNIAFDIRLDPTSAKDLYGGAGYFQVFLRSDNYTTTDSGYAEEFGNPTYSAPTAGTYEHISIPLPAAGANVRALTLQLYNSADRQINGNVVFQLDNLAVTTTPEPAACAALSVGIGCLLRRTSRRVKIK